MPIKMYDLMWKNLELHFSRNPLILYSGEDIVKEMGAFVDDYTFISQPEAIKLFKTSKKTLAHLRDDWGMPYVTRGVGQTQQFFYKEEEVRTHLEELRGKK